MVEVDGRLERHGIVEIGDWEEVVAVGERLVVHRLAALVAMEFGRVTTQMAVEGGSSLQ